MFRIATQYVNYYVVLFNPVTIAGISASAPTSWAHTWVSFPHLSWLYSQSMGSSFQSCKLLSSRGWQDARRSDLLLLRCAMHRWEYPKTLHSWCSGWLVLASPVSTMVEPLLLNHALGGAQKIFKAALCLYRYLVCALEKHPGSTCATLSATFPHNLHRTSPSVEVCIKVP